MSLQKVVNGIYVDLTEAEEAEITAMAEAADLDLSRIREQRDGLLAQSDWTVLEDATLGAHTKAEWITYRQALRDHMSQSDRVSTFPPLPNDPPTQAAIDAAAE